MKDKVNSTERGRDKATLLLTTTAYRKPYKTCLNYMVFGVQHVILSQHKSTQVHMIRHSRVILGDFFGSQGILGVDDRVGFSKAVSLVILGPSNGLGIFGACRLWSSNASGNLRSNMRQCLSTQKQLGHEGQHVLLGSLRPMRCKIGKAQSKRFSYSKFWFVAPCPLLGMAWIVHQVDLPAITYSGPQGYCAVRPKSMKTLAISKWGLVFFALEKDIQYGYSWMEQNTPLYSDITIQFSDIHVHTHKIWNYS